MTTKTILIGIMLLACVSGAYAADDYKFALLSPAKAGTVDLPAGSFKLAVQGSIAVITDLETKKAYTTMVKVETGDKKFSLTSADLTTQNGQKRVQSVSIGGSSVRLVFP